MAGADRRKGRFRALLLTALRNYAVDDLRAGAAAKRRPAKSQFSLDAIDQGSINLPDVEMGPEEAFSYAWASSLLDEVIARVEDGCLKDGKSIHWQVFRARVLRPILEGIDPISLPELCGELKIPNEAMASHMVATVKRRFQAELRYHIRGLVSTDAEIDQEIGDLMAILSTSRAR